MKSTLDYLDDAKQRLGIDTDYKLAKILNAHRGLFSEYRHKKRVIDNYTAVKIAEILEIDPLKIIAIAESEKEKNEERREFWKQLAKAGTVCLMLTFPLHNDNSDLKNDVRPIMRTDRRKKKPARHDTHWRHLPMFDRRKEA